MLERGPLASLGDSDRRSLTRACQEWFGTTPSRLRQTLHEQGGLVSTLAQAASGG